MSYVDELGIREVICNALKEDIGSGDITTETLIPENKSIQAYLLAKEECVVCGLGVAAMVFKLQDKRTKFKPLVQDGALVGKGRKIAYIYGKAKSILTAERVALNFLSCLCGVSTKTRIFVNAVKPYKARILDTRKTTPGLRAWEKYAVRIGGGFNHRFSLDEMIMVKDNHKNILGGLDKLGVFYGRYKVEIEVNNLKEFKQALRLKPDIIMLDNMRVSDIKKAVAINRTPHTANRKPLLEASGGIALKNVRQIASTGIDMISIGELTHSINSVDISLEIL